MWARVIEAMLGCWLAISPFVFHLPANETTLWTINLGAAVMVILLALLSYWHPARHAHFITALAALALIGYGRFAAPAPIPPSLQNLVLIGLLLLMFAIVPNDASQPPKNWRQTIGQRE